MNPNDASTPSNFPDSEAGKEQGFLHHAEQRHQAQGCLPLFIVGALGFLTLLLLLFRVTLPGDAPTDGEGNIYVEQSALNEASARNASPLPMSLPYYADPTKDRKFWADLPLQRPARLLPAPQLSPFDAPRLSVILKRDELLELPPAPEVNADKDGKEEKTP